MRPEVKFPPTKLEKLAQLVSHSPCCGFPESRWSFYNPEQPQNSIIALYKAFSQLRSRVPYINPATFLDCGSGDGTAVLVAHLAGFEKVSGIEKNKKLAQKSQERLDSCFKQGIIDNIQDVCFCHDSYYQLNILPGLVEKCYKTLLEQYQAEGVFETNSFKNYLCHLLGVNSSRTPRDIIAGYLFSSGQNSFEKLDIIKSQKLTIDVVYIYPSDVFFTSAFLPQIAHLLKENARLAVLTQSDNPIPPPPSPLEQKEIINLDDFSPVPMCLQVFQKKTISS